MKFIENAKKIQLDSEEKIELYLNLFFKEKTEPASENLSIRSIFDELKKKYSKSRIASWRLYIQSIFQSKNNDGIRSIKKRKTFSPDFTAHAAPTVVD